MSERLLLAAGATTIIGIILLTLYASQLQPPMTRISDVSQDMLETNIHIQAKVCDTHTFDGGSMILKLCENQTELDAYIPYNIATQFEDQDFKDKTIDVIGTVEVYKGRLELVIQHAENIKLIDTTTIENNHKSRTK